MEKKFKCDYVPRPGIIFTVPKNFLVTGTDHNFSSTGNAEDQHKKTTACLAIADPTSGQDKQRGVMLELDCSPLLSIYSVSAGSELVFLCRRLLREGKKKKKGKNQHDREAKGKENFSFTLFLFSGKEK